MRISEWSSDVCSSVLAVAQLDPGLRRGGCPERIIEHYPFGHRPLRGEIGKIHGDELPRHIGGRLAGKIMHALDDRVGGEDEVAQMRDIIAQPLRARMERERTQGGEELDRKSVVEGKSVSGRVDLGGRRMFTKKNKQRKKK